MVEKEPEAQIRDSRSAILAAAEVEFDTHGFTGARVQRIADAAGVNKQLIFYYFGSKPGLFREVLGASLTDLETVAAESKAGVTHATLRFRQTLAGVYRFLAGRPHVIKLLAGDGTTYTPSATLLAESLNALADGLAEIVVDGQRLGYFRDDCDAAAAARHAISMLLGHVLLERALPVASGDAPNAQLLDSICRVLLKSLEW